MRDELPDWMDVPDADDPPPRRRVHRLLMMAAVPWVLVAVLVGWRGAAGEPDAATAPERSTTPDATTTAPAIDEPPGTAPAPDPGDERATTAPTTSADGGSGTDGSGTDGSGETDHTGALALDELVVEQWGGYRDRPGDGGAVVVALAVARAWLTGVAPVLELPLPATPDERHYAEHLVVEAIERESEGAAVVTLVATVLETGDPHRVTLRRLAVPVDESGDQPRPAGAPWDLPPPELTPTSPPVTEEIDREHWPAAQAALHTAGFVDAELRGLQQTAGWPVLASIRRTTAEGNEDHVVWLRRHQHEYVVAGLPLSEALPSRFGRGPDTTYGIDPDAQEDRR
ncbi:hypothetical protein [Egicoccus halophilus]|uniref:Uncharacterized protein n=1 Tax=Egicoccus halophilus TaxID=1670830 RepID=A0A8J3A667_9ACTN|nr:hypothetical protein [Egicoccus halophilus]GGI03934.1 hypothetical protein GCM10011354_06530 [Egicoccus halophilus]